MSGPYPAITPLCLGAEALEVGIEVDAEDAPGRADAHAGELAGLHEAICRRTADREPARHLRQADGGCVEWQEPLMGSPTGAARFAPIEGLVLIEPSPIARLRRGLWISQMP